MPATEGSSSKARRRPGPAPVAAASLATFLVLLTFLAWQLRAGRDPALGSQAAPTPKKHVLVKRIERTVVVEVVKPRTRAVAPPPASSARPGPASPAPSAPRAYSAPAPVRPAAPSPPPAPAPAPAPAPVTRAS